MNRTYTILWLVLAVGWVACSSPTAESYYRQGRELREADQPVEAVEAFIAATRVSSREYGYKARSWSNVATMCRMGERHDLAYALYEQSLEQFVLAGDTLAQAYALNNMAWEQAVQGNKQAAVLLIDSALRVCPDEAVQAKVPESRAAACLYAAEYDSVLFYTGQTSSAYFDILRAQAYTFLGRDDSALFYARRVVEQTDNPRFLDDVYYILAHCDAAAEVNDIRSLADGRTDIQRTLERARPEWIEAMRRAEQCTKDNVQCTKERGNQVTIYSAICIMALGIVSVLLFLFFRRHRQQTRSLEQQCLALRKCPDIRAELQWNDYQQFRAVCDERLSSIVTKLERRALSEREIRICVLVLIGFSYAEIANILFRAESGIGKDKYIIAKHLGVSVKDLQNTLQQLAVDKHA